MGMETLLSMQKFIEKECEDDTTELDAKRDSIIALRQLFQEFENQLERDDDRVSVSSNKNDEQKPEQGSIPVIHHSQVSNSVDDEEYDVQDSAHAKPNKEPKVRDLSNVSCCFPRLDKAQQLNKVMLVQL